jgi:hypothetical protein
MKPSLRTQPDVSLAKAMAVTAGLFFVAFGLIYIVNRVINTTISSPKELEYAKVYQYFSGKPQPTKTLVVFANNAEQRFGGGFLGSYAILDGNGGNFHMSEVNNIYNIDYDTVNAKLGVPVPEYLKFLAPYLSLRDSGIYHNWPTNAQSAMKFYEADTGKHVDNVVQITPEVLRTLLKETGPVTLSKYNLTITDSNFLETVQMEVEAGPDKQQGKDPKAGILTGLAQVLMERLAKQDINSIRHYSTVFEELAAQKNILLYSSDTNIEKTIQDLGMAGDIKKTDYNYFQITEANFDADKSSPFIKQTVTYDQAINTDGTSNVSALISRRHTSDYKFPYINPYTHKSDWLVRVNNSKIDVLIPQESKLLMVDGASKYQKTVSEDRQVVSYISDLAPLGPAQNVTLGYKIPQHYDTTKTITVNTLIQKQSGGWPYDMNYTLHVPQGYHLVAANTQNVTSKDPSMVGVHVTINEDMVLSFVYEKDQ